MPQLPYMQGTGPGPITPDGCPVEFYALLRARGEPEIVQSLAPHGADILELGAGTGRVTHPLVELGYKVVAVDESPDMLAHIKGAETVCSPIETLLLHSTFDIVTLMSFLVEIPDEDLMRGFLRTCRTHVRDNGYVVLERHTPGWHDTASTYERTNELGHRISMRELSRPAPGLVSASVEYRVGDSVWTHSYQTRHLDDDRLERELTAAGLVFDRFLTDDQRWIAARPRPS